MQKKEFRKRPKGKYIQEANWADLYELTQLWKSELLFYRGELRFFRKLIDHYFLWMVLRENLDTVREMEVDLLDMVKRCEDLLKKVGNHLFHLAEAVENPEGQPSRIFRVEHGHLEDEIASFSKDLRKTRTDMFAITEHVMESEELVNLRMHKDKRLTLSP